MWGDHTMSTTTEMAAAPNQPKQRGGAYRFFFEHTIDEYPSPGPRTAFLGLSVLATIILYYVYYTQTGVTPNILAGYHMTFAFYVGIVVVSNLLGAFASLPASQTDRLGRTNVVIYGLLIVGLLITFGIPWAHTEWEFAVVICLMGIVEGAILVATPALVRDFSPQLGRASAMGFWTVGPVAGSLAVAIIANHTLNHFGQTHWKSQFVISGISALVTFVICLFFLKDLSSRIRDQLMVTNRDQALVEARARGLSDEEVKLATEKPWSQILKFDLVLSALGISFFLLIYFIASSFFTIYYPSIFHNPNGTGFSVTQANGLNTWFWAADIIALIVIGVISDKLRVRKPIMLIGAIAAMIMVLIFAAQASHPYTSYDTLKWLSVGLSVSLACVFAPWMASYTESVEAKNPALVGTGLALWGWVIRIVVGISFIFLPVVITSVNPIVDNLPLANTVIAGQSISNFADQHPDSIAFAQANAAQLTWLQDHPKSVAFAKAHAALLTALNEHIAVVNAVAANPTAANISAAQAAVGPADFALLVKYETQLKTLVQPYTSHLNWLAANQTQVVKLVEPYQQQLAFLSAHEAAFTKLSAAVTKAPKQWQHWFYIDLIGMILFVPTIWLAKGRWSPKKAKRDEEEHESAVSAELAKLLESEGRTASVS
jgi:sugar phosphate permease